VRIVVHQLETVKVSLVNRISGIAHEPVAQVQESRHDVTAGLASQGA
jgi:biopolymer transport protein ExbB